MSKVTVILPEYYDDLAAFEIESKGFLDDVLVILADGRKYRLRFRDTWNADLAHDTTGVTEMGCRYLALPNVVIVDKVSKENVLDAIHKLSDTDFFDRLGPEQSTVCGQRQ